MERKEVTDRIKFLRNKHKYTQAQMAEMVGLEYGSYVQMENGANLPSLPVLMQLSDIFSVPIDMIVYGNINKASKADLNDYDKLHNILSLCESDKIEYIKALLENISDISTK